MGSIKIAVKQNVDLSNFLKDLMMKNKDAKISVAIEDNQIVILVSQEAIPDIQNLSIKNYTDWDKVFAGNEVSKCNS